MNYTPRLECFPFTGQYYLLIKKLAMDLNRFSVNFICMFTQNNVVLRNGAYYSVSNKKLCDYLWSKN
jgi:hypothetical protein